MRRWIHPSNLRSETRVRRPSGYPADPLLPPYKSRGDDHL